MTDLHALSDAFEQDRQAAYTKLVRHIRASLPAAFAVRALEDDLTMEVLAPRIGRDARWVWRRLIGPVTLTLRDISDIALMLGCRLEFRIVPIEGDDP